MLDSICNNELGDPDELVASNNVSPSSSLLFPPPSAFLPPPPSPEGCRQTLADWRDVKDMKLLNLVYDLTPSESLTLVITVTEHCYDALR